MKAEKLVISTVETNIEIIEVTLLSIEEYEACKDRVPKVGDWWWLRSPCSIGNYAVYVNTDGSIYYASFLGNHLSTIRPALRIRNPKSASHQIMDKFNLAGYTWTVVSEDMALCDNIIGRTFFREDWKATDASVYEASDIKKWLDRWVKKKRN